MSSDPKKYMVIAFQHCSGHTDSEGVSISSHRKPSRKHSQNSAPIAQRLQVLCSDSQKDRKIALNRSFSPDCLPYRVNAAEPDRAVTRTRQVYTACKCAKSRSKQAPIMHIQDARGRYANKTLIVSASAWGVSFAEYLITQAQTEGKHEKKAHRRNGGPVRSI